jgi:hypothetical protein
VWLGPSSNTALEGQIRTPLAGSVALMRVRQARHCGSGQGSGAAAPLWILLIVDNIDLSCYPLGLLPPAYEIWMKTLPDCCSRPATMAQLASFPPLRCCCRF